MLFISDLNQFSIRRASHIIGQVLVVVHINPIPRARRVGEQLPCDYIMSGSKAQYDLLPYMVKSLSHCCKPKCRE